MRDLNILIAGTRTYTDYAEAKEFISFYLSKIKSTNNITVFSGGARGADTLGERYARENGYNIKYFLPQWEKYGKNAGPIRNKTMVQKADYVICFWDGKSRGTGSTVKFSKIFKKPIRIKFIKADKVV